MIRRAVLAATVLLPAAAVPAHAQAPRSVVVPAGAGVVIGPRGAGPRLAARPLGMPAASPNEALSLRERAVGTPAGSGIDVSPLAAGLAVALPLAAIALLGSGGEGGGVSAPARTR